MAKKVLIVDDEPDIRISVRQAVENEGFEAKTANNAKQALRLLHGEKFDLVLMDIFMPEMSGRDAVKEIRADSKIKNQKVAFLTVAELSSNGKAIIKKMNPVDYFQKPIELKDFIRRLKKILK